MNYPEYTMVAYELHHHISLKLTCLAYLWLILSTPMAYPLLTLSTPSTHLFLIYRYTLAHRTSTLRIPRTTITYIQLTPGISQDTQIFQDKSELNPALSISVATTLPSYHQMPESQSWALSSPTPSLPTSSHTAGWLDADFLFISLASQPVNKS